MDRHELQKDGKHPAPCARFCEANAFKIALRNLQFENFRLREANETLERAEKLQATYNVPASIPRKRGEAQWKRERYGRKP